MHLDKLLNPGPLDGRTTSEALTAAFLDPTVERLDDPEVDALLAQTEAALEPEIDNEVQVLTALPGKPSASQSKSLNAPKNPKKPTKKAKAAVTDDDDRDGGESEKPFSACLEILTPAHSVKAKNDRGKLRTDKVKKSTSRSPMFTLPRDIEATDLRNTLAKLIGIQQKRFTLSKLEWRYLGSASGTLRSLGSTAAIQNLHEHLSARKSRDKEILFVYTRALEASGKPAKVGVLLLFKTVWLTALQDEYVPAQFPKKKAARKAQNDEDDDPFTVGEGSDSDSPDPDAPARDAQDCQDDEDEVRARHVL